MRISQMDMDMDIGPSTLLLIDSVESLVHRHFVVSGEKPGRLDI
jgi:hypothetical protein